MLGGARCVCTVSLVSTPGISTEELYSLVKDWSYEDTQAARRPEMDLGSGWADGEIFFFKT